MIIYKTTNKINRKIYIGQDSKNNPNYLGSGLLLKKAIKKYGKDNFKKELLQENIKTKEELDLAEVYHQNTNLICFAPIGYNISHGAFGGDTLTNHPNKNEIIRKNSESQKGEKAVNIIKDMKICMAKKEHIK